MRKIVIVFLCALTCIGSTVSAISGADQVAGEKIYDEFRAKRLIGTKETQSKRIDSMIKSIHEKYTPGSATEKDVDIMQYVAHLLCQTKSIMIGRTCRDGYVTDDLLAADVKPWDLGDIRKTLIKEHSKRRTDRGLGGLKESAKLDNIAQKYADKLCAAGYITHDLGGSTLVNRYQTGKYVYEYAAENLAQGQRNIAELLDQLTTSIHHRENMYSPHLTEVGLGHCNTVWVINYGKPYIPKT